MRLFTGKPRQQRDRHGELRLCDLLVQPAVRLLHKVLCEQFRRGLTTDLSGQRLVVHVSSAWATRGPAGGRWEGAPGHWK